jgi:cytochrome P450
MAEAEVTLTAAERVFDPTEPGYLPNPYAQFAHWREHDPVHLATGIWYLFRYDHSSTLLRDPSLSVDDASHADTPQRQAMLAALREAIPDLDRYGQRSLLNQDPPDHTRLRRLMSKAFTPRRVESLRPRVQSFVSEVLDRIDAQGHTDLIADLAFPLPLQIISELLGLPEGNDNAHLRALSRSMLSILDPLGTVEVFREGVAAKSEMVAFLTEVIDWKRSHPGPDLLTALIEARDGSDSLNAEELRDQALLIFVAGHETTVNLIGNGALALMRHREQFEALHRDPTLITNAVEELLRYDSPVQFAKRFTVEPLPVGDRVIPPGSMVLAALGSANRDPDRWGDDADDLDLRRHGAQQHLAFGAGIHHCLGAALARLEGQEALGALARRFPDLTLADDDVVWNRRMFLRGLQRLPLTVR